MSLKKKKKSLLSTLLSRFQQGVHLSTSILSLRVCDDSIDLYLASQQEPSEISNKFCPSFQYYSYLVPKMQYRLADRQCITTGWQILKSWLDIYEFMTPNSKTCLSLMKYQLFTIQPLHIHVGHPVDCLGICLSTIYIKIKNFYYVLN